ncbi:HEAT repeat domain-containing protein [uncultured Desulfobulbus sp.]|uniref:HEAT repeat domain-containing protein n=1 Tax=uncultured Desulfobulbus sp. TaxID=239745 RepID=UPI0029C6FDC3|nr:HEAT repeat domain-containing protein [uncultured Desulfobulbus sp.]
MNKTLLWRAAFIIVILGMIGITVSKSMHLNKLADQLVNGTSDQQISAATELMQRDKLFEKMQSMPSTDRLKIMDVIAKIPGELTIKQTLPLFKDTEAKLRNVSDLAEVENKIRSLQFYQDEKTKKRNAPLLKEDMDKRAEFIKLRDTEVTLHTKIVNVLKVLAKNNIDLLVPAMKDPDVFVGIGVKDTLVAIGPKVIPFMKTAAIEEDLRPHAFEVMWRVGEPSVPTLIDLMHNKDQNIRMAAAAALGVVAKPSATTALIEATNDVEAVRRLAVSSLCAICDPRSTDVLVYVLSHTTDDGEVRARSARALSVIGGPKAINTLVGALADFDLKVQTSVITGLQHIGAPAVNSISTAIASGSIETRRSGAAALEGIDSPEAANELLALSHNADTEVRASAARGLGFQTISLKTDVLVSMLADPDGLVGDAASNSLQNIGSRIVPNLISLISSGAGDVAKFRAATVLGKIGPPAVPALINALSTSGANIKWVAYALGHTGDPRAKPALKKYASASDLNLEAVVQAALHRP